MYTINKHNEIGFKQPKRTFVVKSPLGDNVTLQTEVEGN